jgi:hypothetical protein
MPTLEDTVEFQAATLNDLLEADAKAVALPSEGEGKYRSWAFVSTAAAGLLAIMLVVSLVTDKGGGGEAASASTESKKAYEGSAVTIRVSQIPSDVVPDTFVDVRDRAGNVVLSNVPVTKVITEGKGNYAGASVEVKVPPGTSTEAFDKAFPTGKESGRVKKTDATAATPPATTAPESAPATTPPASTTAETTPPPPASTTPETAPAQTTPPS